MDKKRSVYTLRKRSFLSPASTGYTSYILAEVESSVVEAVGLTVAEVSEPRKNHLG